MDWRQTSSVRLGWSRGRDTCGILHYTFYQAHKTVAFEVNFSKSLVEQKRALRVYRIDWARSHMLTTAIKIRDLLWAWRSNPKTFFQCGLVKGKSDFGSTSNVQRIPMRWWTCFQNWSQSTHWSVLLLFSSKTPGGWGMINGVNRDKHLWMRSRKGSEVVSFRGMRRMMQT